MYGINHEGLQKKQTYDELIEYILNRKARIKHPNGDAKLLTESPTLSNLLDGDGESGIMESEKFNKRKRKGIGASTLNTRTLRRK